MNFDANIDEDALDPEDVDEDEYEDPTETVIFARHGEGSDCETCGWNGYWIEVIKVESTPQKFEVRSEVGCFGGMWQTFTTEAEALAKAHEEAERMFDKRTGHYSKPWVKAVK